MSRFLQIVRVAEDAFTDALYAFVTEPTPARNEFPVVQELNELMPDVVDVLEAMVLDGTEDRKDVAEYVTALFAMDPRTTNF
jgi:hypothetical protein